MIRRGIKSIIIYNKKTILLSLAVLGLILISSCKKDKSIAEKPKPTANFSYTYSYTPAPCAVSFKNYSSNANSYFWDFGDGSKSTEANPTHVYKTGGSFSVLLNAKNDEGSSQIVKNVYIIPPPTKVKITKVTITNMPFVDGSGSGWDPLDGPDVFFNITNQSNNILLSGTSSRINDVSPSMLPLIWSLSTAFEITDFNISRFIDVWDYDTFDPDDHIGYVGFIMSSYTSGSNPYPATVTKTQNGITVRLDLLWQ